MSNTCGQGLAHHSALPAKMATLMSAMAQNLEAHLTAIDPRDDTSRPEHDAYVALVNEHREVESRLRALAGRMSGYAELPMANHDPAAMASPKTRQAFERFVIEERGLAELLWQWLEQHQAMLHSR